MAALRCVIDDQRCSYPLNAEILELTAELWTKDRVACWFGVDYTKLFFYVPHVVTYQPGGIQVAEGDLDDPGNA